MEKQRPNCHVEGCGKPADYEVILYDVYMGSDIFYERDHTCPFLCAEHAMKNEREAKTYPEPDPKASGEMFVSVADFVKEVHDLVAAEDVRRYRGSYHYPYSNQHGAQGFTIYRPLENSN